MTYFLERIAESLYAEFGNTLNRHCLVFPGRRAGLYLLKYLAEGLDKPVWAPPVITINDLFKSYSSLQTAENEILLFELYKIYRKTKQSPVSFDDFFFWGDMLLNDFDDVDKYLVDASLLFRNIKDIKEIDSLFGGLTDEQVSIIKKFWVNFEPEKVTNEKTGFISIWSVLFEIYENFRFSLKEKNLAYEGMIFRELAEDTGTDLISGTGWDMIHFIGFNALNECEKTLMLRLKKAGRARFYWDYDNSYIKEGQHNSAGLFMRSNLKVFGNDMPGDWSYDTILSTAGGTARRKVIATSSDVAQVKLVPHLIEEIAGISHENMHHTAVIVADENLIVPVLTSLPEDVGDINITMGYPLKETLVYTLVKHLMELQRSTKSADGILLFSCREVSAILKHPLIAGMNDDLNIEILNHITQNNLVWIPSARFSVPDHLARIFTKPATPSLLSAYFKDIMLLVAPGTDSENETESNQGIRVNIINEFIYRVVLSINKLEGIVNSVEVSLNTDTYLRIFDRMLRMQSVPFSGEPLSGVQIMGILETRALDFKNLIILSVNEGILPAVSSGSSYIPFSLREAFGLPSVNHQESIYAYHFYRLLHRAENVTFVYNSNPEGMKSGEMSRFLIQMKYEEAVKPEFLDLRFEIKTLGSIPRLLERSAEHHQRIITRFTGSGRLLSPSAINMWLNCRMKFYYRYVNNLKEPETVTADIDPVTLGNILHESMRSIYDGYRGQIVTSEIIGFLLKDKKRLSEITGRAISQKFRDVSEAIVSGNELIVREVLLEYIARILRSDKTLAPFTILNLEDSFSFKIQVLTGEGPILITTGGQVDRIDNVSGVTRIVDYKTGTVADSITSVGDLFADDRKKEPDAWLQTLLYCEAYLVNNPDSVVRPSVYKIKKTSRGMQEDSLRLRPDRTTDLTINDYREIREEFMAGLTSVVQTIFSSEEPFIMTSDAWGKCGYCPYRGLCLR
jgi:hypothetical protein